MLSLNSIALKKSLFSIEFNYKELNENSLLILELKTFFKSKANSPFKVSK